MWRVWQTCNVCRHFFQPLEVNPMDNKANGPYSAPALDRIDEAIIEVLRHQGRITYEKLSSLVHLTPRP